MPPPTGDGQILQMQGVKWGDPGLNQVDSFYFDNGHFVIDARAGLTLRNTTLLAGLPVVDVNANYQVFPNSTQDSAPGINAAIAALGTGPGIVRFSQVGFYTCGSTINIGNGSTSQFSTANGIYLEAPIIPLVGIAGESFLASTVELRTSSSFPGGGALVQINGPIYGCGLSGIRLRNVPVASVSYGLHRIAQRGGWYRNLEILDFAVVGEYSTSIQNSPNGPAGGSWNSMKNRFDCLYVRIPLNAFAEGVRWDGNGVDTNTNTWGDLYDHPLIEFPTPNTTIATYGFYAKATDSMVVRHARFQYAGTSGSGTNNPILMDFNFPSSPSGWPTDVTFDSVDFGNTSLSVVYSGSPTSAVQNTIANVNLGNTQPANPALSRLLWQAPMSGSANTHTVAAGSTTNVFTNTTFDGGSGSTAYTIGDIVALLKTYGVLKP